jgi:hypothetical protein
MNDQGYPFLFFLVVIGILWKRYKVVSIRVLEMMNVLMAICGVILLLRLLEHIPAFYSGVEYQEYVLPNQMLGSYWFAYWFNFAGMATLAQLFWLRRCRKSVIFSLVILLLPLLVRWFSLLTIVHRDYLPSNWAITYQMIHQVPFVVLYFLLVLIVYQVTTEKCNL